MDCASATKKKISNFFKADSLTVIIKCILMFINIVMAIGAVVFLAVGLYCITYDYGFSTFTEIIFFFVFWSITIILGCYAICNESIVVAKAYAIMCTVLLIIRVVDMIFIKDLDSLIVAAKKDVEKQWANEIEHIGSMDSVQRMYQCCGKDSADDYKNILHRPVPETCYDVIGNTTHEKGCLTGAEDELPKIYAYDIVLGWCFLPLDTTLAFLSWYLVVHFTKQRQLLEAPGQGLTN